MKYFAYGSNMDPERMKERNVNFTLRTLAVLEGWEITFNKTSSRNPKEGYANITRKEGKTVEGVLYEINESDLKILDKYEGYPDHYERKTVKVKLKNGELIEAYTYIANPKKVKKGLKPSREYLEHLLKGHDLLSEKYCKNLEEVETIDW